MIRNKIKVSFFLEEGCNQEDGEASSHWEPINFSIYSNLFPDLIQDAIDQWLADNAISHNCTHEVIFAHVVDRDGAGAVLGEYFEPIWHESQNW